MTDTDKNNAARTQHDSSASELSGLVMRWEPPSCLECGAGEDQMEYLETHANGDEYRCAVCGHEFHWDKEPDYLDV